MKHLVILILIVSSNYIFSQNNNIKVKYKVVASEGSLESLDEIKNSKIPEYFKGIDNALVTLEFELDANKTKSHFYMIEGISSNEKATRVATIFTGNDEVFVNKSDSSFIKYKNRKGEKYFVSYTPSTNWTLTNESKKIEGFLCYKATIEKTIRQKDNKIKNYIVLAWYCPEIPYPFGPKEFGNLPGLILELQDNKVTFLTSKIDMNVDKLNNLEIKPESKIISESDYNKIVDERKKELFDKLDKYSEKK